MVHDHQVAIEGGGYAVKVYFEEGKTFSDPDAHVFYEPLIYLELDENGKLEHELRRDGDSWVLSLYFRVESDWHSLHEAIRKELLSEARRTMPRDEFENVDFAYRIKPIHVISAYFRSVSPRQDGFYVSESFPPKSFNESGRYNIYFRVGSEDEARSFLSALIPDDPNRRPTDHLRFVYRFSGVSDAVCEARFSGSDFQSVDAKATIEGPGGEGYVTRNNVAAFAEQVAQRESMTARCADAEWAAYVVGQLIERLGGIQEVDLTDGWESLQEYNLLDENDLAADLENRAKDIKKDAVRKQVLDAIVQARSEAEQQRLASRWTAACLVEDSVSPERSPSIRLNPCPSLPASRLWRRVRSFGTLWRKAAYSANGRVRSTPRSRCKCIPMRRWIGRGTWTY